MGLFPKWTGLGTKKTEMKDKKGAFDDSNQNRRLKKHKSQPPRLGPKGEKKWWQ